MAKRAAVRSEPTAAASRAPRPRRRAQIVLALGSLLVTLAVCELVFRLLGLGVPVRTHRTQSFRTSDGPHLAARGAFLPLSISRTQYYSDPRNYFGQDRTILYIFNSAGFRDLERTVHKPPGIYRILALGDSYLMGQGVRPEDLFSTQLERQMNTGGWPREVEVLNTGIAGLNTKTELEILSTRGMWYDPDLVLVNFVLNDVEDPEFPARRPVEFYREYGVNALDSDWLSRYSRLWSWTRGSLRKAITGRMYVADCLADFEQDSEKWRRCRDSLLGIFRVAREHQVPVMVVIFPFFHQLNGAYPFQALHERVAEVCREAGVSYLDLRAAYGAYAGPELWVDPTDQHPNEVAHAIAAQAIDKFLRSHQAELAPDSRPAPLHTEQEEPLLQAKFRIVGLRGELSADGRALSFAGLAAYDGDFRLLHDYWHALGDLETLELQDTHAGEVTFRRVVGELPKLRELHVTAGTVSPQLRAELIAARPGLKIVEHPPRPQPAKKAK
ncbi:MAG: SGNH/GDSL hydrolase family protein [Pirellulales bacterium]|nr:SGNH/GDSL hydrolase family protein [Pirellulales bacterium]